MKGYFRQLVREWWFKYFIAIFFIIAFRNLSIKDFTICGQQSEDFVYFISECMIRLILAYVFLVFTKYNPCILFLVGCGIGKIFDELKVTTAVYHGVSDAEIVWDLCVFIFVMYKIVNIDEK